MVRGPGQEKKDVGQNDLLYKVWLRNIWKGSVKAVGTPLTVVLAVLAGAIIAIVVLLVLSLMAGLIWYVSPLLNGKTRADLSITERKDLVQGFASVAQAAAVGLTGAAGFIGLAFTWRNLRQTRESTQKTLQLTEQGQITERFTHAIDQLGADNAEGGKNLELRLGGIYALERIARVSEEHHLPIMEVLTAYVREHAPKKPYDKTKKDDPFPEPDIAATLDVIGRRSRDSRYVDLERIMPFILKDYLAAEYVPAEELEQAQEVARGVNLREVDSRGVPLPNYLSGTDLQGGAFFQAYFYAVVFTKADLQGADFQEADLRAASLAKANLKGANLHRADLRWASLEGAVLEEANLSGADLRYASDLTEEQIAWTKGSNGTKLPEGVNHPVWWSEIIEEQTRIIKEHLDAPIVKWHHS
jgi:hypothetical protein